MTHASAGTSRHRRGPLVFAQVGYGFYAVGRSTRSADVAGRGKLSTTEPVRAAQIAGYIYGSVREQDMRQVSQMNPGAP